MVAAEAVMITAVVSREAAVATGVTKEAMAAMMSVPATHGTSLA